MDRRLRNLEELEQRLEYCDRRLAAKEQEVTWLTQPLDEHSHELTDIWMSIRKLSYRLQIRR